MTVTLNTSFGSHIHGTPNVSAWEFPVSRQVFFGTLGEYALYGKASGRWILIPWHMTGYTTLANLQAALNTLAGRLAETGTLTVDLGGGDSTAFNTCTFEGFEPDENPWKDGSGVNGWQVRGNLRFRQKGQ